MENENTERMNEESILKIIIHHSEKLKYDVITQPVVCLHVVNADSGTYVKKSDRNRAALSFYETQRDGVDYLMPIMSQPGTYGEKFHVLNWEETFILNDKFSYLANAEKNVILFFEIIDLIPMSCVKQHYERLNQNGMHKIAWAFLKLVGANGIVNMGSKLRLQLYKPRSSHKSKNPAKIEVFRWWLKYPKVPLSASLYVTLEPYTAVAVEPALRSMLPLQQERGISAFENQENTTVDATTNQQDKSAPVKSDVPTVVWRRKPGEPCKVPNKLSLSLEMNSSCQVLKFNQSGRMLAAACGASEHHCLFIYEIPSGKLLQKNVAHSGMIYDLDWSENENLLTSSADCNAKLWKIKPWCVIHSFTHPSFVYSAKFHPTCSKILATACYDHVVRIWTFAKATELLKELESHHSPVCALSWHDNGKILISGDSSGKIKVWDTMYIGNSNRKSSYDYCSLKKEIVLSTMKGFAVNKIVPGVNKSALYVFCSDSCLRNVSLYDEEVVKCFKLHHTPQCAMKGCCSPCGNLLFASGDDDRVYVWSKNDSEYSTFLLKNFPPGTVSCMDYHPHDHMLAVSSWEEDVPVYLYINDECEEKCVQEPPKQDTEKDVAENNHKICSQTLNTSESDFDSSADKKSMRVIQQMELLKMNSATLTEKTSVSI